MLGQAWKQHIAFHSTGYARLGKIVYLCAQEEELARFCNHAQEVRKCTVQSVVENERDHKQVGVAEVQGREGWDEIREVNRNQTTILGTIFGDYIYNLNYDIVPELWRRGRRCSVCICFA